MDTLDAAGDILAQLDDIDAHVTTDATTVTAHVTAGNNAIIITPPVIDWDTWTDVTLTWTVHVIAGVRDITDAWARLDQLIADIAAHGLNIVRAEPNVFQPINTQHTHPAYTLELTEARTN